MNRTVNWPIQALLLLVLLVTNLIAASHEPASYRFEVSHQIALAVVTCGLYLAQLAWHIRSSARRWLVINLLLQLMLFLLVGHYLSAAQELSALPLLNLLPAAVQASIALYHRRSGRASKGYWPSTILLLLTGLGLALLTLMAMVLAGMRGAITG